MIWPHLLVIYTVNATSGGGSQDDDGAFTDNPATEDRAVVYRGRGDVQDGGKMFRRDEAGAPVESSDAVIFLADERSISLIQEDMLVDITWEDGTTSQATVSKVRRLDGTVWVRRL